MAATRGLSGAARPCEWSKPCPALRAILGLEVAIVPCADRFPPDAGCSCAVAATAADAEDSPCASLLIASFSATRSRSRVDCAYHPLFTEQCTPAPSVVVSATRSSQPLPLAAVAAVGAFSSTSCTSCCSSSALRSHSCGSGVAVHERVRVLPGGAGFVACAGSPADRRSAAAAGRDRQAQRHSTSRARRHPCRRRSR